MLKHTHEYAGNNCPVGSFWCCDTATS